MLSDLPRISFGIRVFNGEPFVQYNLRSLYPFAHQIIVVEGAVSDAEQSASAGGHSTDGTLATLRRFKARDDPEGKVEIATKSGAWSGAEEQSQFFADRATGDYLWMVDVDEFYHAEDMLEVLRMVKAAPDVAAVFFKQITFWGGFDYVADGWFLRQRQGDGPGIVPRLVRWRSGYRYAAHRPISIHDEDGRDIIRSRNVINGATLAGRGIFMYHYSLVFPRQVREKAAHYSNAQWAASPRMDAWVDETFFQLRRPYHVHNVYKYPSWLARFAGRHPAQIEALRSDLASGGISEPMRTTADVERLLSSRAYRAGRALLVAADPFARYAIRLRRRAKQMLER